MVWYLDGKFFVGKEEYKFTNDDWIGTLESPAGEQLPFIDSEGVMACRDFYCHENKAAAICKEAARILQEIHILCSKETNPFKAWANVYGFIYWYIHERREHAAPLSFGTQPGTRREYNLSLLCLQGYSSNL